MSPPAAIRATVYVCDSLKLRINDLDHVLSILVNIPLGRAVSSTDPADEFLREAAIRALADDIRELRDALESVWFTLDPIEAERAAIARGALPLLAEYVMSGIPSVVRDAKNGRLWALARPVFSAITNRLERKNASNDGVLLTVANAWAVTAPVTLSDRVKRIPSGNTHIRIERFETGNGPRFEVYLSGTNFAGNASDPWNAESNFDLAQTGSSPSFVAVRRALASAGVTPNAAIVITGHSQGGLLALALARTGDYTVDAVITVGTPIGVIPDVKGIQSIHVVHPEDPVPAAGGLINPNSSTWVIGADDGVTLIRAHDRNSYVTSMDRLDEQHEPEIDTLLQRINPEGSGMSRDYAATATDRNR